MISAFFNILVFHKKQTVHGLISFIFFGINDAQADGLVALGMQSYAQHVKTSSSVRGDDIPNEDPWDWYVYLPIHEWLICMVN